MNEMLNHNPGGLQQSYSSQQYSALRAQQRSRGQISQKSTEKYNDCESNTAGLKNNAEEHLSGSVTPQKTDDATEASTGQQNTFQFVSFKIEPSKNSQKTMKRRDRNKPLIDDHVVKKQINFQNKLIQYQRHVNFQSIGVDLDDSKTQNQKSQQQQMIRGNMGFCPLDMSLINLCGAPSLWMNPKEYCSEGTYIQVVDTLGKSKTQFMPYIKPFQRKLMKKQYRLYELLRFHKLFENEKYFGRTNNQMINNTGNGMFQDYYFFSSDFIKDNNHSKNQINQLQQQWDASGKTSAQASGAKQGIMKEKFCTLNIIQGSSDVVQPELPLVLDADSAYFKLINSESKILKQILQSQNISQTDQNEWNLLWTCVSLQNKQNIYETMQDHQKINHFQFSTELTRKDRFADNIQRMKNRFGFSQFDFAPETYQLPEQNSQFLHRFQQIQEDILEDSYSTRPRMTSTLDSNQDELSSRHPDKPDNLWIVKPTQSSQGKGIYLIDDLNELNLKEDRAVICKYISNPLLVNNHKFDLRIYVLVTCIDPLRIYIYNEGLARFASEPYDSNTATAKKNLYQHLTNYSINKKSDNFSQNKSVLERDHGNKWSLSALQTHFEKAGINMQVIWERIYDSIIKSIISVEHHLQAGTKKFLNNASRSNCFELFGFDILLDTNFKPHILEVNFSPSLSADSPLDYHIKSNLLIDTLNIVGIKRNSKKRGKNMSSMGGGQRYRAGSINTGHIFHQGNGSLGFIQLNQILSKNNENLNDQHQRPNSRTEMRNFTTFLNGGNIDQYFLDRLSRISAKHRELVFETLDEFQRNRNLNYTCIYPAPGCHLYDKYFENPRNSNQLIHRYLFSRNELYTLTKQISEYQRQAQAILNQNNPNYNKKSMNQDLESPLNEEDEESDDLSEKQLSEKSNDSNNNSQKDENENKKKQDESIRTNTTQNKSVNEQMPEDKIDEDQSNDNESPRSKREEESKLSEKKITIESRKVEVTQVISESIDTAPMKSETSTASELGKPKNNKLLSTENSSSFNTSSKSASMVSSPPPEKEQSKNISNQQDAVMLNELKNGDIDETDIKISPSQTMNKNEKLNIDKQKEVKEVPKPKEYNKPVEKEEIKPKRISPIRKDGGVNEKNIDKLSQNTIESPTKLIGASQKVDISNDNGDCNSPELTIGSKNSKLHKSNSQVDDSTTGECNEQPLLATINEQNKASSASKEKESKGEGEPKKEKQKMIITGDDILIEYVQRIISILDNILIVCKSKCLDNSSIDKVDDLIPQQMKFVLETFVRHKIWSNKFSSVEDSFSLVKRLKLRHHEMVERRSKILRSTMKKADPNITKEAILEVINQQDNARDKIVSRISSQKIEKMVKQSNIENQIDIVRVLIEGNFTLPNHLQTSTGKKLIKGTLQSLKVFEKILRSQNDIIQSNDPNGMNFGQQYDQGVMINRSQLNNPQVVMINNPNQNIQDVLNSNSGLGSLLKNNTASDGTHNFAAFQVQNHKFKNQRDQEQNGMVGASPNKIGSQIIQKAGQAAAQLPQDKKFYRSTVINQKQINYLQKRVDDNDGFTSNMALSANSQTNTNASNQPNGRLTIDNQDINIRLGSRSHQKKSQSFINMQDQNHSQVGDSSVEAPSPQLNKLKNNRISSLIIQQRPNPQKESRNSYQQRTHQQETDTNGGQSLGSAMYINNQSALSQNRQIGDHMILQNTAQSNSAQNNKDKKYISFSNVYQDDNMAKAGANSSNGMISAISAGAPAATNAFSPQIQKNNVIRLDRCMSKFRVVSNSSNQQMGMAEVGQHIPFRKQTTQKFEHQKSTDSPSKYFSHNNGLGGVSSSENPHRNSESRSMNGATNYYQNRNVNNLQQQLFMSNNNDGYNSEFTGGYGNYTLKNQNSASKQSNNMHINSYAKNNRMLSFDSARRGTEINQNVGGIKNFTQEMIQASFGPQTMNNSNKNGQINSVMNSAANSAVLSQQDMSQSINKGITLPQINTAKNEDKRPISNTIKQGKSKVQV